MSQLRIAVPLTAALAFLPLTSRAQALDPQPAAVQALAAASATPLQGTTALGAVRSLRLDVAASGATTADQAAQFLSSYGAALGQSGPDQGFALRTIRAEGPDGVLRIARFAQTYKGLPVFGADAVVGIETPPLTGLSRVTLASGALIPDPGLAGGLSTAPSVGPDSCVTAGRAFLASPAAEPLAPARLMVFDGVLFDQAPGARLVWAVTLNPQPLPPGGGPIQVLCDASTAAVVFSQPFAYGDLDFEVDRVLLDPNATEGWNPVFLGDEDGLNSAGAAHTDAAPMWTYARLVYNYLAGNYGWRGANGNDGFWRVVVDAASGGCAQFSVSNKVGDTVFVDPGCAGYDVAAHEIGHAVIAYSSKLVYSGQSGALNEGYADALGVSIDAWDWLIGEDRTNGQGALRDFQTPPNRSQPDRFSQYANLPLSNDGGGVHTNSGILNKAHYLMVTGDAFNARPAFTGIGRVKMGLLAFLAMRTLPSSATFLDARAQEVFLAQLLTGWGLGFSATDVCAVKSAFAAVEVDGARGDFDCNGVDDGCTDADGDFVCAPPDNCPGVMNANQKDSDMDGQGDACDVDLDNDGRPDSIDNCWTIPNWDQKNTDGDSYGDVCDNDDDGDGISDVSDNCPLVWNPGQEDGDMDGVADACGDFDYDGDGWYDNDNCTFVYNDLQFDTDMDDLGDACDGCPNVADWVHAYSTPPPFPPAPYQPDSDGDGTPDACDGQDFGAASLDLNGSSYDGTQTWAPGGAGATGTITGPAGARLRIPLPLCAGVNPDPPSVPELVFTDLDPSVDVRLLDDDGLFAAAIRPGPIGSGARGLRVLPDCSRAYSLELSLGSGFPGTATFFAQTSFVDGSTANPWVTPGSGLAEPPPPPDLDADGLLDTTDRCPTMFDASAVDSDGDGVGDVCDTCSAAPNPVFAGSLTNRTVVSDQLDDDADGRGNACDFDYNNAGLSITVSDFNDGKASQGRSLALTTCGAAVGAGGSGAGKSCYLFDHVPGGLTVTVDDFNALKANQGKSMSLFPKCAACTPPWSPPLGVAGSVPLVGVPTCAGPACSYLIP